MMRSALRGVRAWLPASAMHTAPPVPRPWLQCVEECDERFSEEQVFQLLDLVKEHLPL